MRTFATFARPGSYVPPAGASGEILVGRTVANSTFTRALITYGNFDRYCFFIGESGDLEGLGNLLEGVDAELRSRVIARHMLELPDAIAAGELSLIHQNSHANKIGILIRLRDRHARAALPITGQIHSLSYPSMMFDYAASWLARPSSTDAIFCSSTAGREVVERCFGSVGEQMRAQGAGGRDPAWELPVVPLGVDVDSLSSGDRAAMRRKLGIPENAFIVLGVARFTEFDKMDLFPVLGAFSKFLRAAPSEGRTPWLVLAGARQGTQTPEMLELWSRGLQLTDRLVLRVDFDEAEKADLLAAADLFISPSDNLQETFGITAVEAMAAGLPVIAADLNGYKDTVSDDVGFRVPTRWNAELDRVSELGGLLYERPLHLLLGQSMEVDIGALATSMLTLHGNDQLRAAMATAAQARARELYDWRVVIPRYEQVWQDLAGRPFEPGSTELHPLTMDFKKVFGHYPTEARRSPATVQRSELAAACCVTQNAYPIYPELKVVFDNEHVLAAVQRTIQPIDLDELEKQVRDQVLGGAAWRASLLIGWLLKHGLIERIPAAP